ncbi:MAG: PTS sugar transporter subunit IIA [Chloroflexota bacterium]|nr:PTS sugar transporter subunit IIA [Chloroflexota bacterium]
MGVLPIEAVRLSLTAGSREDAILATGRILEELQAVAPGYADAMLEREQIISTSVGEGFAIPHGTDESRVLIHRTALSFAQFPAGVDWETDRVFVCIGIAARDDAHLGILGRLADILIQPDLARQLREATDPAVVMSVLGPALEEEASAAATHEDGTAARAG